jgi:DNA-directed RNA polymerase specialized sigma24 family protein
MESFNFPGYRLSVGKVILIFKISASLIRLQRLMEGLLSIKRMSAMTAERDQRLSEAIEREQPRLRNFIRKRVADAADAEDILQEIFYEVVEAYRLMKPVEQVGAWLFRVARNRITDLFRKRKGEASPTDPTAVRRMVS